MTILEVHAKYKDSILSPAFVLPILTGIAYIIAYFFEATYLAYFSVGHQFISITVNIFVLSLGVAAVIVWYIAVILMEFSALFALIKKGKAPSKLFWPLVIITVPLSMLAISIGLYLNAGVVMLIGLGLAPVAMTLLIQHLVKNKKTRKIIEHTRKSSGQILAYDTLALAMHLLLVASLAISTGVIAGSIYASTRMNYLSYRYEDENYVLIREYDNKLIFTSIDQKKKISGKVLIVNPKEKPIMLKAIKVEDHLK